jgi:hypothetical protein
MTGKKKVSSLESVCFSMVMEVCICSSFPFCLGEQEANQMLSHYN